MKNPPNRFEIPDFSHKQDDLRKLSGEFQPKRICNSKMRLEPTWSCSTSANQNLKNLESGGNQPETIHKRHKVVESDKEFILDASWLSLW